MTCFKIDEIDYQFAKLICKVVIYRKIIMVECHRNIGFKFRLQIKKVEVKISGHEMFHKFMKLITCFEQ